MSLILCWSEDSRNLARSWKTHEVRRRLTQCWHSMEQRRRTYIPYVTLDFVLREMQILNMQLIQVSTVLGQSLRQRSCSGLHVSVKECVTAWQSFMDVYAVGYDLEQNIIKFKANSSSPHSLRNQGWSRAKTRHFSMGWFIRSSLPQFDNSPQDLWRTAVQSPLVWIVNKIIPLAIFGVLRVTVILECTLLSELLYAILGILRYLNATSDAQFFSLSLAKSVLRSARALVTFPQSTYYVLEQTPSHLVWCLAVTVLILCSHYPGRILRPWSVLQRVPFLLHEVHQRCIKAPSVPGAPRKGLSMCQSDSRRALGKGAWFTHLSRRQGTCDLQLTSYPTILRCSLWWSYRRLHIPKDCDIGCFSSLGSRAFVFYHCLGFANLRCHVISYKSSRPIHWHFRRLDKRPSIKKKPTSRGWR